MTIRELVASVVGYAGKIVWDTTQPDGTLRKLLGSSRLTQLGWIPRIALGKELKSTYDSLLNKYNTGIAKS